MALTRNIIIKEQNFHTTPMHPTIIWLLEEGRNQYSEYKIPNTEGDCNSPTH